jgi:hypothetical protein
MLPQAHHSPDLSPCDFYLLPKLKSRFKGCHFQTPDIVQKAVTNAIKVLTEADIQSWYEAWKIRVALEGYYSEVNNVDSDK